MYIPKKYGQSKIDLCPFCQKTSITINKQSIPVCINHKTSLLKSLKCICGETVDLRNGKFGPFGVCINCGAMNLKKLLEIN